MPSDFWNGFFKGLAAPCALTGMFSPEYGRDPAAPPADLVDAMLAELNALIPPRSIFDDMAAVRGDFIRALEAAATNNPHLSRRLSYAGRQPGCAAGAARS